MIIRSVTGFAPPGEGALKTMQVAEHLRSCGHEVQTVRLATPPWEEWCTAEELPIRARELEQAALAAGMNFLSLGPCSAENVPAAVDALLTTKAIFCGAQLSNDNTAVASAMLQLAQADLQHNLRFAALAHVETETPFFPAAFARREGFALAMELAPQVLAAGGKVAALSPGLEALERDARATNVPFLGIDPSLTPGLYGEGSIARLMTLLGSPVGSHGAPELVGQLTTALRALPIEQVGYRGVMFAVMEDPGLVEAVRQSELCVSHLLEYASRCGTGLDTVPLPGDVGVEQLAALLDHVAAVADAHAKPLSARLFPAPGVKAGETVATGSPYLFDCPAMEMP
ncbi:MAG: DUF711 family protein [Candidatus Thermoplasmatota archaeon]|nr:DUF711 family protein [Candidatus Thermoplasmatota archaeon]